MKARELTYEELTEIKKMAASATGLLNESVEEELPLLDKLKVFIDTAKTERPGIFDINDVAFQLGSLYGELIKEKYLWKWMHIEENAISAYGVVSQNDDFCCQVHHYIFNLISTPKVNNVKLLFNMLETLSAKNTNNKKFVFLN